MANISLYKSHLTATASLSSATTSNIYQIGGRAGSVQVDTANSADLTSAIKLSNNQSSWKSQSTVYSTDTTDIFHFDEGIEYIQFELTSWTAGDATYTINLVK